MGKWRAGRVFFEKGLSKNYVLGLDKAFQTAVDRAKAIFSGCGDLRLTGTAWIQSLTGSCERPILSLNQHCLENRVNAICITRFSIHFFREKCSGNRVPHNNVNCEIKKVVIDSW